MSPVQTKTWQGARHPLGEACGLWRRGASRITWSGVSARPRQLLHRGVRVQVERAGRTRLPDSSSRSGRRPPSRGRAHLIVIYCRAHLQQMPVLPNMEDVDPIFGGALPMGRSIATTGSTTTRPPVRRVRRPAREHRRAAAAALWHGHRPPIPGRASWWRVGATGRTNPSDAVLAKQSEMEKARGRTPSSIRQQRGRSRWHRSSVDAPMNCSIIKRSRGSDMRSYRGKQEDEGALRWQVGEPATRRAASQHVAEGSSPAPQRGQAGGREW